MNRDPRPSGAVALVSGGIASAFALAACCALPFLLAGLGLSATWLMPVVAVTQPYATEITILSAMALAGSVFLVVRAGRRCEPGSLCAKPAFRWSIIGAAILGAALLVASKIYA
jgi:mercuric ion transport protein